LSINLPVKYDAVLDDIDQYLETRTTAQALASGAML
jgi:hypothetical protein